MPYCEIVDVKQVLRVPDDYTDNDVEIQNCIGDAEAWINGELEIAGISTPLAEPVSDLINRAAKNYAAWFYRRKSDPPVSEKELYDLAKMFLDKYLLTQNAKGQPEDGQPRIPIAYGRGQAV